MRIMQMRKYENNKIQSEKFWFQNCIFEAQISTVFQCYYEEKDDVTLLGMFITQIPRKVVLG